METICKTLYEAPLTQVLDLVTEGVADADGDPAEVTLTEFPGPFPLAARTSPG